MFVFSVAERYSSARSTPQLALELAIELELRGGIPAPGEINTNFAGNYVSQEQAQA